MDRIGAIKESCRLENRRVFLSAPVPFWRRVRLSLAVFGLLCFMSGYWVGNVHAGYAIDGKCYATNNDVLYAFAMKYPYFESINGNWFALNSVSVVNGILSVGITKNGVAYSSSSWNLVYCTNVSNEAFDSALGGAFWAFGFAGVMILYFSSHVIGLVLKKVRDG